MGNQVAGASLFVRQITPASTVADKLEELIKGDEYHTMVFNYRPSQLSIDRSGNNSWVSPSFRSYPMEQAWWYGFRKCSVDPKNVHVGSNKSIIDCFSDKTEKSYSLYLKEKQFQL
jgi:hypothetical protein